MKPILFSTEMVRAILDNRKTVTRRVVKPLDKILKKPKFGYTAFTPKGYISVRGGWKDEGGEERYGENFIKLPYLPGDILYVRETWTQDGDVYRYKVGFYDQNRKWRPSIHMPREAARIFLRVTDVRVERIQDITEEQAIKEGLEREYIDMDVNVSLSAKNIFTDIWNNTIKPKDRALYGWEANPWVFVISFERVEKTNLKTWYQHVAVVIIIRAV